MTSHKGPTRRWPFTQPPDAAAITLRRIILPAKGQPPRPILLVSHDEQDGVWQFRDGKAMSTQDAGVVSMEEMLTHDPTLAETADLPPGWMATRETPDGPWKRRPRTA